MKLFTCNDTKFARWPVGFGAIVLALNIEKAVELINLELKRSNLTAGATENDLREVDMTNETAIILVTGDY